MKVLRRGSFADGQRVSTTLWGLDVLTQRDKVPIDICCTTCGTLHNGSVRWLNDCAMAGTTFRCASLGMECSKASPRLDATTDGTSETVTEVEIPRAAVVERRDEVRSNEGELGTWTTCAIGKAADGRGNFASSVGTCGTVNSMRGPAGNEALCDLQLTPSHFITRHQVTSLRSPDPSRQQLTEFQRVVSSPEWKRLVTALLKWVSQNSAAVFKGEDCATTFCLYRQNSLKKFFQIWAIENPVLQAKLATITFRDKADLWWTAHQEAHPLMGLTYAQLSELAGRELVPQALQTYAHLAWHQLAYKGDIDAYLARLDYLTLQHPIEAHLAHALACLPFGNELVSKIKGMDDQVGGTGIAFSQLKFQIRCFAESDAKCPKASNVSGGSPSAFCASGNDWRGRRKEDRRRNEFSWSGNPCVVLGVQQARAHVDAVFQMRRTSGCAKCGAPSHVIFFCPYRYGRPANKEREGQENAQAIRREGEGTVGAHACPGRSQEGSGTFQEAYE